MPEHLRAFIVILFLSTIGFTLARQILSKQLNDNEFKCWRLTWFVSTITAFLSGNFWVYVFVSTIFVSYIFKKTDTKIALFFIFLLVLPPVGQSIPGLGLINYLVTIDQLRLASLIILFPIALKLHSSNKFSFPKYSSDFFILLYVILVISLELRDTTFTDALRKSFYAYTDIILPYYVASRSIKSITQIKTIAFSIITVAIVISLIAVFEHFKGWLLYRSITGILGYIGDDQLLLRAGSVRSIATLLQPIVLGYFMCIALGVYLFAERYIISKNMRRAGYFILVLGLYVPVSRGPWVGAALMILVFISLGPSALKKIATIAFISVLLIPTLSIVPGGEKYLDLIPFVGKTEVSNITYRQNLYTNSMAVIERNPLFGSTNYILEPEMQALKVNGLIDIVNSFIQIALESGYIGLLFFVGAFVLAIKSTLKQLKRIKDKNNEFSALLRSIIAIIFGILATIATVSSIGVVSILYWLMLGICIACCEMIKNELDKEIKAI